MWRDPCMNINTKFSHNASMHHKMGTDISGGQKSVDNQKNDKPILPPEDIKYIQKLVGNILTPPLW